MKLFSAWKWLVFIGAALIIGGLFCFLFPLYSYIKLVSYSGMLFLINGALLLLVSGISNACSREKDWIRAESILHLVFGTFLLFNPIFSFIIYPIVMGGWIIILGMIKMAAAVTLKKRLSGWRSILTIGACFCVFGLVVLYFPFGNIQHITNLFGMFGFLSGSLYLIDAIRFRKWEDTLDMML